MNCPVCGHKTKAERMDWEYKESGLDNVILKNTTVHVCVECGEKMPVIKDMPEVHKALAYAVAQYPASLTGPMFRFLRKQMKLTATEVADMLSVSKVTVSRWENGKSPIGETNDKLIRMIYIQFMQEKCGVVFKDSVRNVTASRRDTKSEPISVDRSLWKRTCKVSPSKAIHA